MIIHYQTTSGQTVPGEKVNQVRARKVEVGCMVRATSQVQAKGAGPGVPETLNGQRPDLSSRTVPDFLPDAFVYLHCPRLWPLAVVFALAAVSLCPLAPPESDVGFRSKGASLGRAAKEWSDRVLDAMCVEDRGWSGGRAVVERECPLI